MSRVSGAWRASRRQPQGGSADKIIVNLDSSSPIVGSRRGVSPSAGARVSPSAGARTSPIDVEALEDEVQVVPPSQVPPQRNWRTRRQPMIVIDLEVDTSREGMVHDDNETVPSHTTRIKRQRVAPVIHLSSEKGERSSLQSKNVVKTRKEPAKLPPKEPTFTCPVCWSKLEEPSTTICGHIFCTTCIKKAIDVQKKCPTCRKSLKKNNFHRVFLPNSVG